MPPRFLVLAVLVVEVVSVGDTRWRVMAVAHSKPDLLCTPTHTRTRIRGYVYMLLYMWVDMRLDCVFVGIA